MNRNNQASRGPGRETRAMLASERVSFTLSDPLWVARFRNLIWLLLLGAFCVAVYERSIVGVVITPLLALGFAVSPALMDVGAMLIATRSGRTVLWVFGLLSLFNSVLDHLSR